jgi:hypothetical protein
MATSIQQVRHDVQCAMERAISCADRVEPTIPVKEVAAEGEPVLL